MDGGGSRRLDPGRTRRDLALPPTSLVAALVLACVIPAWAALHGLELTIEFQATGSARYAQRVGHALEVAGVIGALVLLVVAIGVRWTAPLPSRALTAGVAVTVVIVLSGVGLAWVNAGRSINPYGPELHALASYQLPPGAVRGLDDRKPSDHPEVTRHWQAPGTVTDLCQAALDQFEVWVDPGTVVKSQPQSRICEYEAARGGHAVSLSVNDYGAPFGTAEISVYVRRA